MSDEGVEGACEVCRFDRPLYEEDEGDDVACLQRYLKSEGVYDGPSTAYFGERTKAAVGRWQLTRGIYSDGVFGTDSRNTYRARRQRQCRRLAARAQGAMKPVLAESDSDYSSTDEEEEEAARREQDGMGDAALLRGLRVALDVGHGGHPLGFEVGTKGRDGVTEFDLNKVLSKEVSSRLKAQGAKVSVHTYEKHHWDRPWLTERGLRAKGHHLFVSCHHNGHNGNSQGTETLVDVDATYRDQELAHNIQEGMVRELWGHLGRGGMKQMNRGVKWQDLGVLGTVPTDVEAACLVEPYFIDDEGESGADVGPAMTGRAARGVADGIRQYWLDRRKPKFRVQVELDQGHGRDGLSQVQELVPGAWCVRHKGHESEGCVEVQAGSFSEPRRARKVAQRLRRRGFRADLRSTAEEDE